jgi:ribosomal protein S27AE
MLGGFIGLIFGLMLDIVGGGFIATIINIDENLEELKSKMGNASSSSALIQNNSTPLGRFQENKKCARCGKSVDSGYTACPHCGASSFV